MTDLDVGIDHCPCGTITGNPWGLCSRCTDAETDDREFWRRVAADPNAGIG